MPSPQEISFQKLLRFNPASPMLVGSQSLFQQFCHFSERTAVDNAFMNRCGCVSVIYKPRLQGACWPMMAPTEQSLDRVLTDIPPGGARTVLSYSADTTLDALQQQMLLYPKRLRNSPSPTNSSVTVKKNRCVCGEEQMGYYAHVHSNLEPEELTPLFQGRPREKPLPFACFFNYLLKTTWLFHRLL